MPQLKRFLTVANLCRLLLAIVLLVSIQHLCHEKPPWKTAWARHQAEGKEPSFGEHVRTGLWWGAAARAGLAAALLVVSFAWSVKGGTPKPEGDLTLGTLEDATLSPRAFWITMGIIVLGAAAMRLPRMSQSFWGDESDSMVTYVHGSFQPMTKGDTRGDFSFDQPTWGQTLFSARHGANNHVLFSLASRACLVVWRAMTGQPDTAFAEWVARIPSLLAGLGSLATLALLLRRWGAPALGLLAALFMALHPWHVRYSTEARGYALMLFLLPLFVIALSNALEKNRWRDWLAFALCEFLLMYAWGGIMYALAMLNVALLVLIVMRGNRIPLLVRWLTASLLSAATFVSLYLPHVPQIASARKRLLWIKGLPMDEVWFHNLLTQPFTGISYHEMNAANPNELSWQRLFHESPVLTAAGFSVILAAFVLGLIIAWRRNKPVALLVTSVFVSAVVCTVHFKFVLGDELRSWYLIFTLPFVCLCVALGLQTVAVSLSTRFRFAPSRAMRAATVMVLLSTTTASVWPMNASLITRAFEDYKRAAALTCGGREAFSATDSANLFSVWLWRYSALYAPRGDTRTRNAAGLRDSMAKAQAAKSELYVIVGFRKLAQEMSADMLAMLEDPALFEKTAAFPSCESLHTLEVYRMKK